MASSIPASATATAWFHAMGRMTDRVFEFSTLVVRKRLILELIRRAEEVGPVEGKFSIDPAATHFELAAGSSGQ